VEAEVDSAGWEPDSAGEAGFPVLAGWAGLAAESFDAQFEMPRTAVSFRAERLSRRFIPATCSPTITAADGRKMMAEI
jgi:hypothetical protein